MAGLRGIAVSQAASPGDHLQSGMQHARKHSVFESLMQVTHFPQFFFDPARLNVLLELAECRSRRIIFLQGLESRLGRKHSALDCEMNSLESRGIEEACGVAED